jgi:hypothetical protein
VACEMKMEDGRWKMACCSIRADYKLGMGIVEQRHG